MSLHLYADGIAPNKDYIDNIINNFDVKGFTCNPSLIKQFLPIEYKDYCLEILRYARGLPVSIQVLSNNLDEIERQAYKINSWGENIYIKIPSVTNTGISTSTIVKKLLDNKVKINVTAIFTPQHVASLLQAGITNNSDLILSVFSGRISDTGILPNDIIREVVSLIPERGSIKILWAGSRSMSDIIFASEFCDIITLPTSILDKLRFKNKDLNQYAIETVEMFTKDGYHFKI
jgi:transaldolase